MGESEETRLSVLETEIKFISASQKRIEDKLDKYNGIREKLDNACRDIDDHRKNHWKSAGLIIAGAGIFATLIGIFVKFIER